MKKFDWKIAEEKNNPRKFQFLLDNHRRPLTEAQFVEAWQGLKVYSNGRRKNKKYSPSASRQQYKRFKEHFGFFI